MLFTFDKQLWELSTLQVSFEKVALTVSLELQAKNTSVNLSLFQFHLGIQHMELAYYILLLKILIVPLKMRFTIST